MATENIKAFFDALSQDEALQRALKEKELAYTGMKEYRESVVTEVLIPVAKEAGYGFTLEDLKDFEKGMRPQGELDEEELESVAGGTTIAVCMMLGVGGGDQCTVVGGAFCFIVGT